MSDAKEFHDLAAPEDAVGTIAGLDVDPGTETVALEDARGRVLAERVDATLDVPGFDRASMDGYAVRARDTFGADESDPAVLDLVGAVHAGETPDVEVGDGECAEISTGAVVPRGADAVVMVERTQVAPRASQEGERVDVKTALAPGDNVMVAGADVAAGERALGPGTRLTPREIGLLSALGVAEVPVRAKPTVGIVSTGDELVRPGDELDSSRGQIHDVNSYTIATAVAEAGGDPVLYPHAGDDYDEMERQLRDAAEECDLVVSSGSTSASAVDVIYRVIEERGDLLLHGVAVKPGKPMLVGELGGSAYVGLPGYPVSALTIFSTFVAPKIRDAAGLPEPRTATVTGSMATRERYTEGRTRLMPVGLVEDESGETLVYPVDKGSGATTSLVEADGIVRVDADTDYLDAGEPVEVQLFSPDVRAPTVLGVGEDDPLLSRVLDRVRAPRYLSFGSREGARRLRNSIPDFAVASGPIDCGGEEVASWTREWGLVTSSGGPESLADLVDGDYRFVNRGTGSGLRGSFDAALSALADERGESRGTLADEIEGYEFTVKAHASPARKVAEGRADAGLGLRATAEELGLDFVSLGEEPVTVYANPDRVEKRGVRDLETALGDAESLADSLPGYDA